jgi:monoterpene epsilon-lactone hydrolase
MTSKVAELQRPVVKAIGRRLARAETPSAVRRLIRRTSAVLLPCTGVRSERDRFGGLGGLRLAPRHAPADDRAMLLFHGGGYVFGSAKMYRGLAGRIAKAAVATVYVPDYRLAPEHPHPAALEDGLATYRALLDRMPAGRLVVGGDSAGGGLALATLQAAHILGLPMPAGLVLLSPWLDLRPPASDRPNAGTEILIPPEIVDRAVEWYCGRHDPADLAISPVLGDMSGLPPTLVQVSSTELLRHDSDVFATKATAAGVDVTLEVADDLWHVWQLMAPMLPEAKDSIARIGRFVADRTDATDTAAHS